MSKFTMWINVTITTTSHYINLRLLLYGNVTLSVSNKYTIWAHEAKTPPKNIVISPEMYFQVTVIATDSKVTKFIKIQILFNKNQDGNNIYIFFVHDLLK